MRERLILILLLCISTASFGKKTYTMTTEDFSKQFNENHYLKRVYCLNEKGEKVWLHCNNKTILTIHLKNNKTEDLMLQTIKLKQGIIEAVKYNVWMPTTKVNSFDFKEVETISIDRKFQEDERPYFNIDSSLTISKHKNDSLRNIYSDGNEYVIVLTKKGKSKIDTFRVIENACYHLTFNNGKETEFGVIQKITEDSIYTSNFFNSQMALKNDKPFELLGHRIIDVAEINLLKSGGYSYNTIKPSDYFVSIERRKRTVDNCPFWYAVNHLTGEVNFYRLWQIDGAIPGIKEKDGRAIWYEGERKE